MYKQGLYHDWVPKIVQLLMILICVVPFLTIFGVYTGNISDMVCHTGTMSEYFVVANYASFIGMTAVMPLLLRTKQYFRTKEVVIGSFTLLAILGWVCASTESAPLMVVCSFFMGALKMMGLLEFILPIFYMLSPKMNRLEYYPVFYPAVIILAQVSSYYFSYLSYIYSWESVYTVMNIYMLVCATLSVIFMHNSRAMKKVPFYQFDWTGFILFSLSMMVLCYVFVFAKFHGWMQTDVIFKGGVLFLILFALFMLRQVTVKRPYIHLAAFKKANVWSSLIMISLLGLLLAAGSVQTTFAMGVLKYNAQTNMQLNLLMIPGSIAGGILSGFWFKRKLPMKGLIIIGFSTYVIAYAISYLTVSPVVEISVFFVPTILKGAGLCILYIAATVYLCEHLDVMEMLTASTIFIMFRSFIGPALFSSITTWMMYKLQWQAVGNLASHIDASDFMTQLSGGGIALYGRVQMQAIMIAVKKVYGFAIIGGLMTILYIVLHRRIAAPSHYVTIIRRRIKGTKRFVNTPFHKKKKGIAETAPTAI